MPSSRHLSSQYFVTTLYAPVNAKDLWHRLYCVDKNPNTLDNFSSLLWYSDFYCQIMIIHTSFRADMKACPYCHLESHSFENCCYLEIDVEIGNCAANFAAVKAPK